MRILHVTREQLADRRYGLGKSLWPLIEVMQQRGHTLRYLCQDDLPPARRQRRDDWLARLRRWPGIKDRPFREMLLGACGERLQMGIFAAEVAADDGYSHVHLHDPWIALGFLIGKRRRPLPGVRWGVTEHGFGSYSRATHDDGLLQGAAMQRLLRRIEAATLQRANWVMAPTRLAQEALARDLGLPWTPANWQVVPHARPPVHPGDRAPARQQLGWPAERQVVLAVGRIVPLKHFDAILRACLSLAQTQPQLHLQILGEGPREALQAMAQAHGFGERLHIAVTDDIQRYLNAADLYVSMSSTESFGLANLEALCSGLPAICTAVGGVPEVVADGAWLIPRDEETLARCLQALLNDPQLCRQWQQRGLAQAARWPDNESIGDAYLAIYQG